MKLHFCNCGSCNNVTLYALIFPIFSDEALVDEAPDKYDHKKYIKPTLYRKENKQTQ